ncbi:MAG: protein kinase, partial [Planctomycetes bacterium]|nr:protein kinase [Planctomycetota bacterium]
MSCDITEERLWSWIDRSAPELDEHLAGCSRCRDLAEEVRRDMQHVSIATAPPHDRLPERIGSYTVSRLIGEGGQGLVYEAEQQTPRRRVALKVLKNGDGGRNRDVRLFEREVESLARLEHSGIASIYEAGRTEDGRNYFAMELIDGAPLNTYVRERGLTLRDRLGLFTRICDSVTYAHQRGVIHRDLKPSNILVDQGGAPHILDFGLARTTDSDVTLTLTEDDVGKIQGTLPYMCPEQAAGNGADADVR